MRSVLIYSSIVLLLATHFVSSIANSVPINSFVETAIVQGNVGGDGLIRDSEFAVNGSSDHGSPVDESRGDAFVFSKTSNSESVSNINSNKMSDSTVNRNKMSDSTVNSNKMSDSTVNSNKMSDSTVNSNKMSNSTVSSNKMSDSTVNSNKMSDSNINSHNESSGDESSGKRDLFHFHKKISQAHKALTHIIQRPLLVEELPVPQRVVKEKSCGFNMKLENEECTRTQIIPAEGICPPPYRMQGDACILRTDPIVECPNGFNLQEGVCVSYNAIPAGFSCKGEDEDLEGTSCVKTVPRPPTCPSTFEMRDNTCVVPVRSKLQCPPDYKLSRKLHGCVPNGFPASKECPKEAIFDSATKECYVIKQHPRHCPAGFVFHQRLRTCAKQVAMIPTQCPAEFNVVNGVCEKVERHLAEPYCPSGYERIGGSCIQEIEFPPHCPPGYEKLADGSSTCERIVQEIQQCTDGTTPLESEMSLQCQSVNEHHLIQCCPYGFDLIDEKCRRLEQLAPTLSCKGDCYKVHSSQPAYVCPADTEFVDHPKEPQCVRRTTTSKCEPEQLQSVQATRNRCLKSKKNEHKTELRKLNDDDAFVDDCAPQSPSCYDVPQEESFPAERCCPDGGEVKGDHCVLRELIPPVRTCDVGKMDMSTGLCSRETVVPAKSECPPGTLRNGNRCISYSYDLPIVHCPEGSERGRNGVCVASTSMIVPHPKRIETPLVWECLSGQLTHNNECVEVQRVPLLMACPEGALSLKDGEESEVTDLLGHPLDCLVTANPIEPAPVKEYVSLRYACPQGTSRYGRYCHSKEIVPPKLVCHPNSKLDSSGHCLVEAEQINHLPQKVSFMATPVCPLGSKSDGTRCITRRETEALIWCPNGFILEGEKCQRSLPIARICPIGSRPIPEGCLVQTVSQPIIKIAQGCLHNIISKCDNCPRTVTSTCHRS